MPGIARPICNELTNRSTIGLIGGTPNNAASRVSLSDR